MIAKQNSLTNKKTFFNDEPMPWLLEDDPVNPGVRYFALRDLMGMTADSAEVIAAQELVMTTGPVPAILAIISAAATAGRGSSAAPTTTCPAPGAALRPC